MEAKENPTIINNQWLCTKCTISHPQNHNFCYQCGTQKPPLPSFLLLSHVIIINTVLLDINK